MADLFEEFEHWVEFNCMDYYFLNHHIGMCCNNSKNTGKKGDTRTCHIENCPKIAEFNQYLAKEKTA